MKKEKICKGRYHILEKFSCRNQNEKTMLKYLMGFTWTQMKCKCFSKRINGFYMEGHKWNANVLVKGLNQKTMSQKKRH